MGFALILNSVIQRFNSVQSLSHVRLFVTPMNCSTPGLPVHHQLLEFTQTRLTSIKSAMPSSHLILCRPLLFLPPIPPSIRVFSNESSLCMSCPKYWSFSFSIIPSKEIQGLISFRIDWLDFLAVQGTLESLLQHHSSKASVRDSYKYTESIQKIQDNSFILKSLIRGLNSICKILFSL